MMKKMISIILVTKRDTQSDTNQVGESKSSNTNDDKKGKKEADTYVKGAGDDFW